VTDIAVEYLTSVPNTVGGDFSTDGVSLGAEDPTRVIVAVVSSRTAVTAGALDGNATAQDDIRQFGSGTVYHSAHYRMPWPTGAAGDFDWTRAAGTTSTLVSFFRLTGPTAIAVGTKAANGGNDGQGPQSITNDLAAGGALLYAALIGIDEEAGFTWGSATQDVVDALASSRAHLAAHKTSVSLISGHSESLNQTTWDTTGLTWLLSGVEYVPAAGGGLALPWRRRPRIIIPRRF
jgi:hypothetical protein